MISSLKKLVTSSPSKTAETDPSPAQKAHARFDLPDVNFCIFSCQNSAIL